MKDEITEASEKSGLSLQWDGKTSGCFCTEGRHVQIHPSALCDKAEVKTRRWGKTKSEDRHPLQEFELARQWLCISSCSFFKEMILLHVFEVYSVNVRCTCLPCFTCIMSAPKFIWKPHPQNKRMKRWDLSGGSPLGKVLNPYRRAAGLSPVLLLQCEHSARSPHQMQDTWTLASVLQPSGL